MAGVDNRKVLLALHYHRDCVSYINSVGCLPVLRSNVVHVDAVGGRDDHVAELNAHGDDTLRVVKNFVQLMQVVDHRDLLIFVEVGLNIVPVELPVDNVAKIDCTTSTGTCQNGAIVGPAHVKERAALRLVKGV